MNYAARMCVGHSLGGTSKNIDQCRQRKSSSCSSITLSQSIDDVAQITPAHVFHCKKQITITITPKFVERHGAGMGDVGSNPCLTQEPLCLYFILAQVIVQSFVNNCTPQIFIKN